MRFLACWLALAFFSSMAFAVAPPPRVPEKEIRDLVEQLRSDEFDARKNARTELLRLSTPGNAPFLYRVLSPYLEGRDADMRRSATTILNQAIPVVSKEVMEAHTVGLIRAAAPVREARDLLDEVFNALTKNEVKQVETIEADREKTYAQIAKAHEDLKADPDSEKLRTALEESYEVLAGLNGRTSGFYEIAVKRLDGFLDDGSGKLKVTRNQRVFRFTPESHWLVVELEKDEQIERQPLDIDLTRGWARELVRLPDGKLIGAGRVRLPMKLVSLWGLPTSPSYRAMLASTETLIQETGVFVPCVLADFYEMPFPRLPEGSALIASLRGLPKNP